MDHAETATSLVPIYLAGRDAPCPSCAYNLRDLRSSTCPECGLTLRLRIQPAEARLGPFLAGLIALSGAIGFSVLLLGYATLRALEYGWNTSLPELWPLIAGALVGVFALLGWIRLRRVIARQSAIMSWSLATACFLLPTFLALWFFTVAT